MLSSILKFSFAFCHILTAPKMTGPKECGPLGTQLYLPLGEELLVTNCYF